MHVPWRVDALVTSDTHKLVCTFQWLTEHSLSDNLSLRRHQDGEEVLLLTDLRNLCLALVHGDIAALQIR